VALNSRGAIHPKYVDHVAPVLRGFAQCTITIFDPQTNSGVSGFDAWNNVQDGTTAAIWTGKAQMQVFRQTLNAETPAGGITQIRSVRFTVPLEDIRTLATRIKKGQQVHVTSVESIGDDDVMTYQYTITSGVGATLGWTRTIEAETNVSVVV
jgi:hypothetical protein